LPDHPDHAIYRRDFSGSGSLFAFRLRPGPRAALAEMMDHLELFAMGYSWGGFESLCIPANPAPVRTAVPWTAQGPLLRVHVGFEGFDELKADLAAGIARYVAALG